VTGQLDRSGALLYDQDCGICVATAAWLGSRVAPGRLGLLALSQVESDPRIAAIVVPKVNKFGGSKAVVASAVNEIEAMGSAEAFVDRVATTGHVYTRSKPNGNGRWYNRGTRDYTKFGLFGLPAAQRLALEMALHEESERRALDGELAELERAWREAEEIAGISDDLLISPGVQTSIDQIRDTMKDSHRG